MSSRYEQIYDIAKGVMDGRIDIELPMISVFTIFVLALIYMVTASMGIDMYETCDNVEKSKKINQYMSYTLTIALTIPFTLLITKLFGNDTGAFMILYGIMGTLTSYFAFDLVRKCDNQLALRDVWTKFTLGLYAIVLIVGIILSAMKSG
jgi:hypothetical protein